MSLQCFAKDTTGGQWWQIDQAIESSPSTPFEVDSLSINASGTQLSITFNRPAFFGVGGNGGLTISPSFASATLTYVSGAGTTTLIYSTSRTIYQSETVTASYVQPGNGIEDSDGLDLVSFSNRSVTNNSTQVPLLPTTGLTARYEPAGVQQSAGLLTGWLDSSGNARNVTSVPVAPTVATVVGRTTVRFTGTQYFDLPASVSTDARSLSMYVLMKRTNFTPSYFILCPVDGALCSITLAGGLLNINDGANKTSAILPGEQRQVIGTRNNATNTRVFANGEIQTLTVCGAATGNGGQVAKFPTLATNFLAGDIEAIYIYSNTMSDLDLAQARDYWVYNFGAGSASLTNCYVMEGDSITDGLGVNPDLTWPNQFAGMFPSQPKWFEQATTGNTVVQMIAQYPTQIGPLYAQNAQFTNRWAILVGGTNDITSGATATDLQNSWTTWCGLAKATGYKVAIATVISCGAWNATQNTHCNNANTWLRANYASIADVLCDLRARPQLQNPFDLVYYQADTIHPTAAGDTVIADVMRQSIPV